MSVLKDERHTLILRYLYKEGKAAVPELCKLLKVSPATVRRDLDELDSTGLAKKTHGGVVLPDSTKAAPPVIQRRYFQAEEKRWIGKMVASLIQDGETIFLGSGSTMLEVAENLKGRKELTVITNSLPVSTMLAEEAGINTIITGGFLRQSELSLIGHLVENSLAELRADRVFMSIDGIHLQHGLTNHNLAETITDRVICHFAPSLVVAADHTKFNKTNASFVADLKAISILVTDEKAPSDFLVDIQEMGIEVMIAKGETDEDSA